MPSPSIEIELPQDAPPWLRDSIANLTKMDLGCHYVSVLAALVRLEKAARFEVKEGDCNRLPTTKQPKQISEWVRVGHSTKMKKMAVIKSVSKYGEEWDMWWNSIQPSWRTRDQEGNGEYGTNWEQLDCSSVNGCLSAVGGLYFWGVAARASAASAADVQQWDNAVQNVVWVFESLRLLYN
ncbi:hypothetical protein B0H17DRAFT_949290 [Mycena rosella]|uniref:Uncharacterized protein n=1 Tax=Mycena rosella TaxID=1033263 RepID=A0AAD7CZ62_MYCRO|nr:hypothetical protein B0H17DRAFT_949290 [Mycena rosella]